MDKQKWSGVRGKVVVELYHDDGRLKNVEDDEDAPPGLHKTYSRLLDANLVDADEHIELIIHFDATGYYDPGSMYGGPDRLGSPPEGEDERVLNLAYLRLDGSLDAPLDLRQQTEAHAHYLDLIDRVTLEGTR